MKKIILFILSFFIIPCVTNASVIVMDMDTNRVLYGNNEHEKRLIASTTKIMTT